MKRSTERIVSLAAVTAMLAAVAAMPVSAENVGLTFSEPTVISDTNGVTPRTNEYPTEIWNISIYGRYNFAGQGNGSADLYTNYMFTGVDPLLVHVENEGDTAITVKVKKKGTIITTTVHTFTVPANSIKIETVDVNANSNYYLAFSCPSKFSGYVF